MAAVKKKKAVKTRKPNAIGSNVVIFKRDEEGKRTEEVVLTGVYLGTVEEWVSYDVPMFTSILKKPENVRHHTHFSVGLIRYVDADGNDTFGKAALELIDFV